MDQKKIIANLLLLLTAVIWGSAFVAQRVGMEYIGPFTFCAARFLLSALVLVPVVLISGRRDRRSLRATRETPAPLTMEDRKVRARALTKAGAACGCLLFLGSTLQQFGLVFTTAGKAGFITALYIVLVPIIGLALKHRPGFKCWIGVAAGTAGLYLLCITEAFTIAKGDFILLIGAVFWAAHVLVIDHFLPSVNAVKLALFQFSVCALLSALCMLLFEQPDMQAILDCAIPILYAGVLSGGVGFTLQIVGQQYTSPTVASLLLSMEAVFGAIFGFLLLHEVMSGRELTGCGLMFFAIVISQLPDKKRADPLPEKDQALNR